MLRFRCESPSGPILAMGLSFDNLRLLEEQKPIMFDLAPYGSAGDMIVAHGDAQTTVALKNAFPERHVVTLTSNTLAALRRGEAFEVPLADIEVPALRSGFIFAGKTERALVDMLRQAGLVGSETTVDWGEYEAHERNEVADCEPCRGAKHRSAESRQSLRERIYRHPNLVAFGVLLFAALVTLLVKFLR